MFKGYRLPILTILIAFISFPTQAQWSPIMSPETESIAIVYKDTVSGRYFASSSKGQFYFTNSLDEPWQVIPIEWRYDAYAPASFNAFLRNGEELYAVPEYVSTDNGSTWTYNGIGGLAPTFLDDTLFYAEPNTAYIYKKTDTNSRVLVNSQLAVPGKGVIRDLIAHKGNLIVSQYRSGLFFSTDRGVTFTESTANVNLTGFAGTGFYATDSALYFSAHSESSVGYFLKSTDGGATWVSKGGAPGNATYSNSNLAGYGNYLFAANYLGVFRSEDEGATWTKLTSVTFPVNTIFALNNEILLASKSGVHVSTDNGETFTQKNAGFDGGVNYTSLNKIDNNWYLTTDGGEIFKSEYLKTDWSSINPTFIFPSITKLFPFNDKMYVFTGKGMYSKSNESSDWIYSEPPGINPAFAALTSNSNSVVFNDTLWSQWNILLGQNGLYTITAESGFTFYTSNLPTTAISKFTVVDSTLFALVLNNGIWRRYKNKGTWEKLTPTRETMDLINGKLYASSNSDSKIYVSEDLGTTWEDFGSLINQSLSPGSSLMEAKDEYYLISNGSVYAVSLDSTKTWIRNDEPLWDRLYVDKEGSLSSIQNFLGVFEDDIYGVGSDLRHVYINKIVGTSVEDSESAIQPESFILLKNYPNPFNPSTTIQFQTTSSQVVELHVFDIMGRLISTVFSGKVSAGEHRFQWNADGLASGIYLYQLKAANRTSTQKMVLIK